MTCWQRGTPPMRLRRSCTASTGLRTVRVYPCETGKKSPIRVGFPVLKRLKTESPPNGTMLILIAGFQNLFTSRFYIWNIVFQRIPNGGNVNCAIRMNIEISCILDDAPGNGSISPLDFLRQLTYQFTNLNYTHTTCVLEHVVSFERRETVIVSVQIVRDTVAICDDLAEDKFITIFDRATPRLLQSYPRSPDRRLLS